MVPTISDIIALPGWNAPMLLFIAKATLILIAALGMTIAMQRGSAGARHLVWLATLATLLLVPAVTAWAPPLRLAVLPPVAEKTESKPALIAPTETNKEVKAPAVTSPVPAQSAPIESTSAGFLSGLSGISLALAVWGLVAFAIAMWLAYGALIVRRIVNRAHALDSHDWLTPLYEVSDRLELENPPRLLASSDAKMPFACGFLSPTIVLPSDCESWSADRRRAVLLHELAHVKRHDLVGHTLGRFACAIYWFHPLVWTAAKQLRNESERACDDLALSCGARASDYAEHLLDIVTSVRRDSTPAVALAMARRKEFEGRMLAILDPELRHSTPSRKQSFALIGTLAAIAVVVGAAAPAPRAAEAKVRLASSAQPVDSEYTLNDRDIDKVDGRKLDKSIDKSVDHVLNKTLNKSIDRTVDKSIDKSLDKTLGANFSKSISEATSTATNEAIRQSTSVVVGKGFIDKLANGLGSAIGNALIQKGDARNDERAALLANVLKTESDPALRRTAAWGLSEYADMKVATDALAEALRKDSDASVREMAAWALADGNGSSTAVAALSTAIRNDSNERVRATAIWALGNVGDKYNAEAIVDALSDKNKDIRMRAAWAIGNIEPRDAPKPLIAMLRDPDPEVRELTAWALYQIEDVSSVDALNAALKPESSQRLQIAYIRALAAMGEKSVDAVRGLLTSSDPKIKSMAIRALAGGNAAGPWPWPWPEPRPYP